MSVDWFGRWTEDPSQPIRKWCDYDYLAAAIRKDGYEPKTGIENLIAMVFMYYYGELEDSGKESYADVAPKLSWPQNLMTNISDVCIYVDDCGGWAEFDYEV